MIRPQEIRIGSWLMGQHVPFQWSADDFQEVYTTKASPIPLTSTLLEKAGFYGEEGVYRRKLTWNFVVIRLRGRWMVKTKSWAFIAFVDHLHQFQNVYFDLTETELPIDLKLITK